MLSVSQKAQVIPEFSASLSAIVGVSLATLVISVAWCQICCNSSIGAPASLLAWTLAGKSAANVRKGRVMALFLHYFLHT